MPEATITLTVNGSRTELTIPVGTLLVELVRDHLGLTGTKLSCGMQVCGACTVLVNGRPVSSCSMLAVDVDGRDLVTIEGLGPDGQLSDLQRAFVLGNAVQCGFCTPGFLMAATALLAKNPRPTRDEVVHELEGNICRCTGYLPIIEAVLAAAGPADRAGSEVVDQPPDPLRGER